VLLPGYFIGKDVALLRKISELSVAFVDDCLEDALARSATHELEIETVKGWRGKKKRRIVANVGDIVIH
jgi:hypothetical protein